MCSWRVPRDLGKGTMCCGFLFAPQKLVVLLVVWVVLEAALAATAKGWAGIFLPSQASGRRGIVQISEKEL